MSKILLISVFAFSINCFAGVGGGGGGVRPGTALLNSGIGSDFIKFDRFAGDGSIIFDYKTTDLISPVKVVEVQDRIQPAYLEALKLSHEKSDWVEVKLPRQ